MQLFDGHAGVVDDSGQPISHALHGVVNQPLMRFEHGTRVGQARPVRIAFDKPLLVADHGVHSQIHALPGVGDELPLLTHVWYDLLCRIRRRRGAKIGGQIDERPVVLMPDCRDDWFAACRRGTYHVFVGEADEVFETAAATRDDDDVHSRVVVELADRLDHLRRALRTLDVDMLNHEVHRRPTQVHVGDDIAFGAGLGCANQADATGKFRKRNLVFGVEQAFAFELLA